MRTTICCYFFLWVILDMRTFGSSGSRKGENGELQRRNVNFYLEANILCFIIHVNRAKTLCLRM